MLALPLPDAGAVTAIQLTSGVAVHAQNVATLKLEVPPFELTLDDDGDNANWQSFEAAEPANCASRFRVICRAALLVRSPDAAEFQLSRPYANWMLPVANTSAPLSAV